VLASYNQTRQWCNPRSQSSRSRLRRTNKLSKTIPKGRPTALLRGFAKRDTFAMSSKARRPLQPLAAEKATELLTFGCRAAPTRSPPSHYGGRATGRACPLWVKSRPRALKSRCPLYPQKRTLIEPVGMSALCQKRKSCRFTRLPRRRGRAMSALCRYCCKSRLTLNGNFFG
jgi:hypothetical protein